jgi:hypothetical protein
MDKSNEYQANAAYCQHMAEAASRGDDKQQQWSTFAQHWLRLGRPLRGTETEIQRRRTGTKSIAQRKPFSQLRAMAQYRFELQVAVFKVEAAAEEELPNAAAAMAHALHVARALSKGRQGPKLLRVVDAQGNALLTVPIGAAADQP